MTYIRLIYHDGGYTEISITKMADIDTILKDSGYDVWHVKEIIILQQYGR